MGWVGRDVPLGGMREVSGGACFGPELGGIFATLIE
jgi:hypothetical protein